MGTGTGTGTNEQDETSSFSENICDKSHAESSHRCFAQEPIQYGLLIQANQHRNLSCQASASQTLCKYSGMISFIHLRLKEDAPNIRKKQQSKPGR